ncbi:hypothetical protein GCM10022225_01280 [Plantactinospora mayteni]|uniref:Uncharacterized protein n=1 Tax=Plantactinospora mayteni TaxID=566021 RepID=A0ABQ4EYB8_9ACTN|nr:hypothetical protein Pma05_62170 [Plantactinospora mayteni]
MRSRRLSATLPPSGQRDSADRQPPGTGRRSGSPAEAPGIGYPGSPVAAPNRFRPGQPGAIRGTGSAARLRAGPAPIDSAAMSLCRERISQPSAVRPDTPAERGEVTA